jgi:hypothetical protein
MTEALDPRYVAQSVEGIREECQHLLDSHPLLARSVPDCCPVATSIGLKMAQKPYQPMPRKF